jgi:ribosomal protein S18 acetylase RimI-like enzyme
MAGILYPEEEPGALAKPVTVNPLIARQVAAQRAAYPRQQLSPDKALGMSSDLLTMVPGIGDAWGLARDVREYATNPESRTFGNYGLSVLGLLPFMPGVTAVKASPQVTIGRADDSTWVVKSSGKEVGRANLADSGDYLTSVRLDPEFKGRGVGSELYDFIERDLGKRLKPSPTYQTPDAKRFWEKRAGTVAHQDMLLGAVDKLAYERGGWAPIRELPQGNDAVWTLIDKGLLEESSGYVRRKQ